jgi:hypothetical protein
MHPFWSSHEEKRVCVRLSMGGGHGRSWSFMGRPWGLAREEGGEGEGAGGTPRVGGEGTTGGRHGGDTPGGKAQPAAVFMCAAAAVLVLNELDVRKERRRKEKKKKRKEKK